MITGYGKKNRFMKDTTTGRVINPGRAYLLAETLNEYVV
jgi:hypothetical protein